MSEDIFAIAEAKRMQHFSINKANQFIRNSMNCLNVTQQRILGCAISMLDSRPETDIVESCGENSKKSIDEQLSCEFSVDAFCKLCGIERRASITYLAKMLKDLRDTSFWMKSDSGELETFAFVDKAKINPNTGKIEIILHKDMKPYLLGLERDFTSYKLPLILHFQSKHSYTVFDLVYSKYGENSFWYDNQRKHHSGSFQMQIDDLKSKVAVKLGKNGKIIVGDISFKDFRINMLEPAIADINKYTDIFVDVEYIKKGRKVELVQFNYRPKTQKELDKVPLLIEDATKIL